MKKIAAGGAGCIAGLAALIFAAAFVVILAGAGSAAVQGVVNAAGEIIGWLFGSGAPDGQPGNRAPNAVYLWTPTPRPEGCSVTPTPVVVTATPDAAFTPGMSPLPTVLLPTPTPCPTSINSFNTPNPHEPVVAGAPHGSPLSYWTVTQHFGCTPETYENYEPKCAYPHRFHTGVDISTVCNAPIHTTIAGQVVIAGWNTGGFGQWVAVEGQDRQGNTYRVFYPHLASIAVAVGQIVNWGDLVGLEGTTGNSTGCHTHYMVYVNGFFGGQRAVSAVACARQRHLTQLASQDGTMYFKRLLAATLALALAATLSARPTTAQSATIAVLTLRTHTGIPVAGAICRLDSFAWGVATGEETRTIAEAETDSEGRVAFDVSYWPRANYVVRFAATDHTTPTSTFAPTQRVPVETMLGGENTAIFLVMGDAGVVHLDSSGGTGTPFYGANIGVDGDAGGKGTAAPYLTPRTRPTLPPPPPPLPQGSCCAGSRHQL